MTDYFFKFCAFPEYTKFINKSEYYFTCKSGDNVKFFNFIVIASIGAKLAIMSLLIKKYKLVQLKGKTLLDNM